MMNKELYLEKWHSSASNREHHFFLDQGKTVYLFGYNPKYFTEEKVKKILELSKLSINQNNMDENPTVIDAEVVEPVATPEETPTESTPEVAPEAEPVV